MHKIILASQSPRRKQLLEWAEVPFEVLVKSTDEKYPDGLPIEEIPIFIARQKAIAIKSDLTNDDGTNVSVIAADTVVVLDDKIIGKPLDRQDAINILASLSGRVHKVITGVVIHYQDHETAFSDSTMVTFHTLTYDQIVFYVDKYKPYDKAGAYAIQEWIGVIGIKSVSGDFYNVMGLPVSRVILELKKLSVLPL